tara:strand:+ start:5484 stop:5885 length:402 start_codon:yes stop_codon:yes gene_type:complete
MLNNTLLINDFPSVSIYKYEDKYLYFEIKEGACYDLDEMIAVTEFMLPFVREEGRRFFITDLRISFLKFTEEAQVWNANFELAKTLRFRNALLVNNVFMQVLTNLFIRLKKPNIPTKCFINEIEAKKWLNSVD